jgi:hypothetical protein
MIDNNTQELFIQEALNFFAKNNLDCEFRDNKDGVCTFITPETKSIILYEEDLDLSINVRFEKNIDIEIEHLNSCHGKCDYNLNIFQCKLEMILEYIELHKKLKQVEYHLHSTKLDTKWKSKLILKKLNEETEKQTVRLR